MPTQILPDMTILVQLLGSAAFISGFVLIVMQVMLIAFERRPTGTAAPITGAPITAFALQGAEPDRIRNRILLLVSGFRLAIAMYAVVAAARCALVAIETVMRSALPEEVSQMLCSSLEVIAPSHFMLQLWFAGTTIYMIVGIVLLLARRVELAQLVHT